MRGLAVAVFALALAARSLTAQSVGVSVVLPGATELATQAPAVRTNGVLSAGRTAELIRNGFPARLHYKLERWAAGTFVNDVKATGEWEVIAQYDPLAKTYKLVRATTRSAATLGTYADLADADVRLAEPFTAPVAPPKRGEKSYYVLTLDVEAMSLSDLDEVQRWLRGELRPAVRGRRDPGAAVSSGVRTLIVRILGGERIVYQATTGVFRP
ncbi:MAG: hypothetical protein M3Z30_06825 [Gemmatimonadota bacterium]|nr:hypothetical protein [Gemmatimonadota bacterium]